MASIGKDSGGRKRILFVAGDGKRKTIRLGEMSQKQAESFKSKLQLLIGQKISGQIDDEVTRWLTSLEDIFYGKLAAVGLVSPRHAAGANTLGAFIDNYLAGRTDVKPSTLICLKQARRNLVAFFGEGKPLKEITKGDAEEYWRYLIGKVSINTARRMAGRAKQYFRFAMRKKLVTENPFEDLKTNVKKSAADRQFFITPAMATKVLDACPDVEWRLIFSLSRYGGLRCPSEHLLLRWTDIDFGTGRIHVRSPKTEHIEGHESRMLPMFPELRKVLMEAFELAEPGTVYVISRYRDTTQNLRTQFERILKRASLSAWPKLFHNLRASRQTELTQSHPNHVVCAWIGNTEAIAKEHYLQVLDADFEKAIGTSAAQIPAQQPPETIRNDKKTETPKMQKTPAIQGFSAENDMSSSGLYRT